MSSNMFISFEWIDGINFKWESLQYKIILFIQRKYNKTLTSNEKNLLFHFFHRLCNIYLYDLKLEFYAAAGNLHKAFKLILFLVN